MTRRGTLAYYLAAWVIGCFVAVLCFYWATAPRQIPQFFLLYFFALMLGAVDLLLFAFLLRRIMRLCATHTLWVWALAGAAIFSALIFLLALIAEKTSASWSGLGPVRSAFAFAFGGASAIRNSGFWQAPMDGAATAVVLGLIDRAFVREPDPREAASTQPASRPA